MSGTLFVVGTPIGNLDDLSPRAQVTLQRVALVVCEDTRRTGQLLRHFGATGPMLAMHAHNEHGQVDRILGRLQAGDDVALVSDAGMPLISDPGFPLVRAAREEGLPVMAVPGPCAISTALAVCGLPADRFVFDGFLPAKAGARRAALQALAGEARTVVLYEAPHRMAALLGDVADVMGGDRQVRLARELTKKFETVHAGTAAELAHWAAQPGADRKGEFVVIIAGAPPADAGTDERARALLEALAERLSAREAAKVVAQVFGGRANDYYKRLMNDKSA